MKNSFKFGKEFKENECQMLVTNDLVVFNENHHISLMIIILGQSLNQF